MHLCTFCPACPDLILLPEFPEKVFIVVTVVWVSYFFLSRFPTFCCAWAELFLSSTPTKDFCFVGHRQCHVTYHCQSGIRLFEPWNVICNMHFFNFFYHISSTMGFCKWLHWYTLDCWLAKITITITIILMPSWISSPPYGWYHWLVWSSWNSWGDLQVADLKKTAFAFCCFLLSVCAIF